MKCRDPKRCCLPRGVQKNATFGAEGGGAGVSSRRVRAWAPGAAGASADDEAGTTPPPSEPHPPQRLGGCCPGDIEKRTRREIDRARVVACQEEVGMNKVEGHGKQDTARIRL